MKNLLLIADSTTVANDDEGNVYFRGSFSKRVWQRYLNIAEKVTVLCRKDVRVYSKKEAERRFEKLSFSNIEIKYIINPRQNVRSFLNRGIRKNNERIIKEAIELTDAVVIRT